MIQAEGVSGLTPATIGTSGEPPGRPGRRRHRLAVRPRVDRDQRHRQRAQPPGQRRLGRPGQRHDVPRHPDRRRDQPRQQRRPARRPGRPRGRHQLLDPDRRRGASEAARSASASRSRSTRCCRSSSRWPTARPRPTPGSASPSATPRTAETVGTAPRSARSAPGPTAEQAGLEAGDVITKVDDHADHRRRLAGGDDPVLPARRHRHRDLGPRRRGADRRAASLDSETDRSRTRLAQHGLGSGGHRCGCMLARTAPAIAGPHRRQLHAERLHRRRTPVGRSTPAPSSEAGTRRAPPCLHRPGGGKGRCPRRYAAAVAANEAPRLDERVVGCSRA